MSHLSEFGQNYVCFQLVSVNTSGFHVQPLSEHLFQIRVTDHKIKRAVDLPVIDLLCDFAWPKLFFNLCTISQAPFT